MTSIGRSVAASSLGLGLVFALAACGSAKTGDAISTPSPAASASPMCVTSGVAVNWPTPDTAPASPAIDSVTANGDVLTMTFRQGTPAFEIAQQADAHFTKDPSGQPVTLAGTAGAKITLRGFRGDLQNYTGGSSISSSGGVLLQVMEIGDSEGIVTWAVGASGATCATVTSTGSSLTFHFIPRPGA